LLTLFSKTCRDNLAVYATLAPELKQDNSQDPNRTAAAPRGGRGAASAPRGGRGVASSPRGGRGAANASRGGRGAVTAPRGGRARRLEFISEENNDNDEAENNDTYEADGEEEHDGDGFDVDNTTLVENHVEEENEDDEEDGEDLDLWLRGPAGLPPLPATEHDKWVISPAGDR
jgi:hypothetical protein